MAGLQIDSLQVSEAAKVQAMLGNPPRYLLVPSEPKVTGELLRIRGIADSGTNAELIEIRGAAQRDTEKQ